MLPGQIVRVLCSGLRGAPNTPGGLEEQGFSAGDSTSPRQAAAQADELIPFSFYLKHIYIYTHTYIEFLPFQRSAGEFCLCPSCTAFIKPGVNTQACRGENTSYARIFPWKSTASCIPAGPTSCLEACCLAVSFLISLHQGLPAVSKAAAVPAAPRGREGKRQRRSLFARTLMVQSEYAKSASQGKKEPQESVLL